MRVKGHQDRTERKDKDTSFLVKTSVKRERMSGQNTSADVNCLESSRYAAAENITPKIQRKTGCSNTSRQAKHTEVGFEVSQQLLGMAQQRDRRVRHVLEPRGAPVEQQAQYRLEAAQLVRPEHAHEREHE